MGIVRFSIRQGLTKKFHSLINPGTLPFGHQLTAKDHSDKTHKLPIPPNAIGDTDYVAILGALTDFLSQNSLYKYAKAFPLFVLNTEMEIVENILTQFCTGANIDVEPYILLPLTHFFQRLRENCEQYYKFKSTDQFSYAEASISLKSDIYKYHKGNGCHYHENKGGNCDCALARPTRAAYTILYHTVDVCNVKKKYYGLHYPVDRYTSTYKP